MEVKYINDMTIETVGTSGKGSFICNYETLVRVLGEPLKGSDDYKTQAEWDIEYKDGTITTVYDWKQGKRYLGEEEGIEPNEVIWWNIGGNHCTDSVEHLKDLFISKGYGILNSIYGNFEIHEVKKTSMNKVMQKHL